MDGDHMGELGRWADEAENSSQNVTCFGGICFGGLGYWGIKMQLGCPLKLDMFWWVVARF
jgi:hypothetical protein